MNSNVVRDGYTKSGRLKSEWCSVCGHTRLQHIQSGIPSKPVQIWCKKCKQNCNAEERVKFSYSKPEIKEEI